jgi:hypothetical protein
MDKFKKLDLNKLEKLKFEVIHNFLPAYKQIEK